MKYNSKSFSDKKLLSLSSKKLDQRGNAPWFEFSSEIYSHGKTFREKYKFPKILPIPISSDHGINVYPYPDNYELNSKGPFFTWNKRKYDFLKNIGRETYYVEHPWISYRKKLKKSNVVKKGTIVFFPKTIKSLHIDKKFINNYLKSLNKLPNKCKPISICLYFNDINQSLHKELRKFKYPLVTAGNTSSTLFVDRFYELLNNFQYATSPLGGRPGSYFYLCIEAGIPFFFYGKNLKYYSDGKYKWKKGKISLYKIYGSKNLTQTDLKRLKKEYLNMKLLTKNFFKIKDKISKKQRDSVLKYLGTDSKISTSRINHILWKSFFFNFFKILKIFYYGVLKRKIKKILFFIC